ncbi:tetratricopeptide repeat protein [Sphingomonas sp. PB4P5]|uniref:tetratricopeptide repeat protein n=1 Tax=Parasphingomonas puruogangriensis TaxID=3096155 RepID=UPI002FCABC6B
MAVPPKTDEAFLREVDEELRRDQLTSVWTRYGWGIIGAIVLALALFAGFLYWRHHQTEQAGVEGEQLQAGFDELAAKPTVVPKQLQALGESKVEGYRVTARFLLADQLLLKGDLKGAAAKFAEVAADTSLEQPFRDLALVRQTTAEFDTLKPDVVVARLKPLAVAGNPWFGSAGELVAAAYVRQNRKDLAAQTFAAIARDEKVPDSIRQRAIQMAGAMGVDATVQTEQKKAL